MSAAAQMLLAKQISKMQSAEQGKALARLGELGPEIGRLLSANYSVTVTVEVEVPKTVNIAGVATQTDPDMIVYFRGMYIDHALPIRPPAPAGEQGQAGYHAVGEVDEKYANPRRGDDPHDYTLDQQIRAQMGDPDPTGRDEPRHPTHKVVKRSQTFLPETLNGVPTVKEVSPPTPAPAPAPEPELDEATASKLAEAPTRVQLLTENVAQYRTAAPIIEKLKADPLFRVTGDAMAGAGNTRTRVIYWSEYDRPRAEKLAEFLRAQGLPAARAESGGEPSRTPGYVQINVGRDAEK